MRMNELEIQIENWKFEFWNIEINKKKLKKQNPWFENTVCSHFLYNIRKVKMLLQFVLIFI